MTIRPIQQDDLVLWADGSHCHYHELSQMSWKSDDYEIIPSGTDRYNEVLQTN